MENGEIVEMGSASDVFDNPQKERTRQFLLKNNVNIPPEYVL